MFWCRIALLFAPYMYVRFHITTLNDSHLMFSTCILKSKRFATLIQCKKFFLLTETFLIDKSSTLPCIQHDTVKGVAYGCRENVKTLR